MFAWRKDDFVEEYWLDAWQRSILFLDVLRERGNNYREHNASAVPHALQALVGLGPGGDAAPRRIERDLVREADERRALSQLEKRFDEGGRLRRPFAP